MPRSLRVKAEYIPQVKRAVRNNRYVRQRDLAEELGIALSTVSSFLNGRPVDYLNFYEICQKLGQDLQEIADYTVPESDRVSSEVESKAGLQLRYSDLTQDATIAEPIKKDDPNFVGRESEFATLNALVAKDVKVILIQGSGGVGKTTLARKYLADKFGDKVIEFPIAKETKDIAPIEGLLEQCLRSLGEEPGRDFLVSLTRLKEKLKTEAMGVLIDNLEPALDNSGQLIEAHRRYLELLRILADPMVKSITLITSRETLGEGVDISLYRLQNLTLEAWQTYFYNKGITHNNGASQFCILAVLRGTKNLGLSLLWVMLLQRDALEQIWDTYQGNALAMKLLSDRIFLDYDRDLVTFWQEYQQLGTLLTVENLIKEQFDRLEKIYPDAYNLLCRMGCYRYKDVASVPLEGVFCLLWDIAEDNKRGRVVKDLHNHSLVDYVNGEYHLHPLIWQEAVARLKNGEDWEKANRQAAEFWTKSVKRVESVKDALQALEAYYHYVNIEDYEQAVAVMVKERKPKIQGTENLGGSFNRLGLFQKYIELFDEIVKKTPVKEILEGNNKSENTKEDFYNNLAFLHNNVALLYRLTGQPYKAIEAYKKAENLAEKINDQLIVALNHGSIGLVYMDLGDYEQALNFVKLPNVSNINVMKSSPNVSNLNLKEHIKERSYFCSAFIYSCLGDKENAQENLTHITDIDDLTDLRGWGKYHKYIFAGLTYKNLGDIDKALKYNRKAIELAEISDYTLIKAKALTGLGELSRIQQDYDTACQDHLESIKILDKIGAKCDLAEAYFQLALTYQAMGELNSQIYFDKARELWSSEQIDAPKQIERVEKAMKNYENPN